MKVMVIVKATVDSEAGQLPTHDELAAMGRFNEELAEAGVMLAGEGLHPGSRGVRVRFDGGKRSVIEGPFAGTGELVAGFWLWQVRSLEEAVEWLKRAPFGSRCVETVEIRPVFTMDDFGQAFTPELREQEQHLRERIGIAD